MRRPRTRWPALALVGVTAALSLSACGSGSGTGTQVLAWSDEFSGPAGSAPDPSSWNSITGGDGFGNQELECYTSSRENSALDGAGNLVITARNDPHHQCDGGRANDYTSARLTTQKLHEFTYGTLSVRAKVPTGAGIWPAFWALGSNHDTAGWPRSGEIDVSEVIGKANTVNHGSLHGPTKDGKPYTLTGTATASQDLGADFHVYSVTWTRDSVSFSLDGKQFYSVSKDEVLRAGDWVFDQPFYLLLNVAVGGTWPGPPSGLTTWPQQMVVDYVRVYQDA